MELPGPDRLVHTYGQVKKGFRFYIFPGLCQIKRTMAAHGFAPHLRSGAVSTPECKKGEPQKALDSLGLGTYGPLKKG